MSKPKPAPLPPVGETRKIGDLLGMAFQPPAPPPVTPPNPNPYPIPAKKPRTPPLELWISKAGRAGKAVTVIKGTCSSPEKDELNIQLKRRLGVGGAVKDGEILIQSSDRTRISEILGDLGWATKICGG